MGTKRYIKEASMFCFVGMAARVKDSLEKLLKTKGITNLENGRTQ